MTINVDRVELERVLCAQSFSHFIRRAWPHVIPDEYQHNWHIDAIADHLEAVNAGQINRLLVNVPPGSSKSTIIGIMYPAWLWGPAGKPWHRYIGAAHEQGLAVRDNRIMRQLVRSDWYQQHWPVALQGDQNEKLYFENAQSGFRQACAVRSMTGRRGHTVAWDDPLSPEDANTDAGREKAIRVLSETVPTRLNDPKTSDIIIVMQRLHENDPSGHIIAKDLGYDHLCIPMEYEGARKPTSIGWTDPRKVEGELMFPDRFPQEVIDRDKKAMGSYAWAGQMQQRPSPLGGGLLRTEWWKYYKKLPDMVYRTIYADTAQKTKEQSDYSVFECWGKSKTGQPVLIDLVRGKWEAPELLRHARAFWQKHKAITNAAPLRAFKIEDKSSGTGLIQTLKREGIPIIGIPRSIDKVTRCMDIAPTVEAGQVLLPDSAPWLSDFLAEANAFPNGAHDDMLDPMFDAVADMTAPTAAERMAALTS